MRNVGNEIHTRTVRYLNALLDGADAEWREDLLSLNPKQIKEEYVLLFKTTMTQEELRYNKRMGHPIPRGARMLP